MLPIALYVLTFLVAIFGHHSRDWILPVIFLLLPFSDKLWRVPLLSWDKESQLAKLIFVVVTTVLLFLYPAFCAIFFVMLLVAALPEEWFFRAYLQKRFGNNMAAILVVSLMFSLLHFIAQNSIIAWLVFIPSLFFGWLYKKTGDLVLVIIMHALSNLVYYIYLESSVKEFFGR